MQAIEGQSRAVDQLQAAVQADRVHHAMVFHGPAGVGKCTTAIAFARLLLCSQRQADLAGRLAACGSCESCRLLADVGPDDIGAAHPDLHIIRKELAAISSNATLRSRRQLTIPIDLLREFMVGGSSSDGKFHEAAAYKTAKLRHGKVFVIDEAELLATAGQNVLLKTLEEPPAGTYIILVTSDEDRLLPTVRSRCHRIGFAPLDDALIRRWCDEHGGEWSAEELDWLVTFAQGSLGLAKLALDYDLRPWGAMLRGAVADLARRRYPEDLGQDMAKAIDEFAAAWVKAHDGASKDAANRRGALLMWSALGAEARRRLREVLPDGPAETPGARDQAEAQAGGWLAVIDAVQGARRNLDANVNLTLLCEHLVSRMFDPSTEAMSLV